MATVLQAVCVRIVYTGFDSSAVCAETARGFVADVRSPASVEGSVHERRGSGLRLHRTGAIVSWAIE